MSVARTVVLWLRPAWAAEAAERLAKAGYAVAGGGEAADVWVVEAAPEAVAEARRQARAVVAVGEAADGWRAAVRAGAADFVVYGEWGELVAALDRLREVPEGAPAEGAGAGQVVVVFGAKGGVGRTTLVANLAWALAELGENVAAVDLDLEQGDLDIWFGTGLGDGAYPMRSEAPGHPEALERQLVAVRPGLRFIPAPKDPGEARAVHQDQVGAWLERLRRGFRFVVVDTAPGFTNVGLRALKDADRRFLVLTPELPAVRATLRALDLFRDRFGWPDASLQVVLNRVGAIGLGADEVAALLGRTLHETIPSDGGAVVAALNRGRPFVADGGRGPAAAAVRRFAARLAAREPAPRRLRFPLPVRRRSPEAGREGRLGEDA